MNKGLVIAAVKGKDAIEMALSSSVELIFDLEPSIETVENNARISKEKGKRYFIHIDLAEGIGKDKAGIGFVKKAGVYGIISTKNGLIRLSQEAGLKTVQRLFIVDTHSVIAAESLLKTKPDMVEIMPGVVFSAIDELSKKLNVPVIAGGLISKEEDAKQAIKSGAVAVSTSSVELWNK